MEPMPPMPPHPLAEPNMDQNSGETLPPPPPPPHHGAQPDQPVDSQPSPPTRPPPGGGNGSKSASERMSGMIYPLALAVGSFVVSFVVGVMAANAAAAGLASRLMTLANAVATVIDNRVELLAEKYRPATFDTVVKALIMEGRKGVPAYQQYPVLGMILVPVMTAILFVFMFA
ncbi:hypothetical protein SBRCBS47491_002701 [Sporothrix bragantina]|uniref:H(+)-exporting diphosphatase n=1 Tax=Sporothrix bragantina TaxID=671064 RepID=A0ABP0B8X5_9PEZI